MRQALKSGFVGFFRTLLVALVTSVVILALLSLAYGGASKTQQRTLEEIRNGTLAQVCVLALPVDPNTGRDASDVRSCLTRYGLTP